jgi:NAD(P)H-dependent FMN reductase
VLEVHLIVGSTREGRAAERVLRWLERRIEAHDDFELTVHDLRDWPLPMFSETMATIGDPRDPTYSDPLVRRWNQTLAQADAFVFLTPEYNHSFSGVIKNAIDNVFVSYAFRNKPAAIVSYSGGAVGGARAAEQLALVAIETELVPLRNTVLVAKVGAAFDEEGEPTDPTSDIALGITLDDLGWWGRALRQARAAGELPPGSARMRAAVAARAAAAAQGGGR